MILPLVMEKKKKKQLLQNKKSPTKSEANLLDNTILKFYFKYKKLSFTEKVLAVLCILYLYFYSISWLRDYLI